LASWISQLIEAKLAIQQQTPVHCWTSNVIVETVTGIGPKMAFTVVRIDECVHWKLKSELMNAFLDKAALLAAKFKFHNFYW